MLTRVIIAVLNGVVTLVVLLIIAAILRMVGLGEIAGVVDQFAWLIAVLVGLATFLGAVPNYWNRWIS